MPTMALYTANVSIFLAFDPWWWAERLSWIVTILTVAGLGAAIVQLGLVLAEQRRIAAQLTAAPKIKTGFMTPDAIPHPNAIVEQSTVPVPWSSDDWFSAPIVLGFGVANEGTRTAVGLYHEITFRADVDDVKCIEQDGQYFSDRVGMHHVVWQPENLHPRGGVTHYVQMRLSKNVTRIDLRSVASYQDSTWTESQVRLDVSARPVGTDIVSSSPRGFR